MAGNWWDADKIDGPESAGNWWDADAVVKDDAPSAATAGPDAKGDGFFSLDRAKQVLGDMASLVGMGGDEKPRVNSVLNDAAPLPELKTTSRVPVKPELRKQFEGAWDAATPKERDAMAQRTDWLGQLARERAGVFERLDASAAGGSDAAQGLDTRAEKVAVRKAATLSGDKKRAAERAAKEAADAKRETPSMTAGSVAQDVAAGALQIWPTAVKGAADIARLATGDRVGAELSADMESGMQHIRETVGSDRAAVQRAKFNADMADDSVGIGEALMRNKGALADQILPTVGSMFLPVGAGAVAGRVATVGQSALSKAALVARVTSAQTAAGVGAVAAQNAADTFAELVEKGVPMERAYLAAGITVPFSVLAGKLTGGGAEAAITKALTGTAAVRLGAKEGVKAGGREGFQEMGETAGQIAGKAVGTGEAPSLTSAGKELAVAGVLGAAVGGGAHVATAGGGNAPVVQPSGPQGLAGELARLEQMRAPRPTVADIGKAASVDEAIATAEQSVAPDVPPSVQPAQAAQVPAGTGRAVQLDEADLLKRAMAGIDMPQEAAQPALAQAAPVVEQQAAPEAATPAAQDQPVRTWFGRRGDGYATPEDAQRGLSERQRLQKDLQWRIEQTPEGRYRLAGYAAPVGGTQALQTPSPQAVREAQDAVPVAAAAQPVPVPQVQAQDSGSDRELLGRDFVPLADGGKTFRTQKAAKLAQGQQKHLRVLQHQDGGFYLAPKTPAQLAAEAKASQRLGRANTSAAGMPIPAHAFIAAAGGMQAGTRADMGVDGNPRIGNRTLFAGAGKGLSLERATEMLVAEGYLRTGASHSDALALLKRSLTNPQYTAEGFERMAQADEQARFEDYLAAQEEAAAEGDADPFGMADEFTAEELDEVGYTDADPALQAEVAALIAQAEAIGIDTLAILEDIARTYANATQDQYNAAARDALAQAIARGNQDGGSTAAQAAPAAEPAADQGLDPTPALDLASQTPAEWQTDSASERFSVGSSLTKEQRRQVLASLVDAYKAKGAQREFKGLDGNGNERYGYTYSPDLFEKSDITGAMVRYYVTLPDGRIAHPSELFPDVSASDVERMALEQDTKRVRLDAYENAIKPYYSDFESANLMAVRGQVVIKKSGRFAIIPERTGAIGQARQNGWELASPSGQVSEQSAGTRAGREQQDGLTSYTAEEAAQRQEEAAQAAKAETARQRAADAQAARDDERKRIAQASVRAADNFELGQDPLDSLTGQGSIFDAPAQSAPTAASDDEGRERFTLSIEMFGDVPYRASKPVDADGGEVVSSRVITTKTKLTKAQAQSLGLPADKGQVFAWRVSVVRGDGGVYPAIEVMAQDHGRSPDGEVLAHFKPVDTPETVERVAPAVMKAAAADLQAAQDADADTLPGFSRKPSAPWRMEAGDEVVIADINRAIAPSGAQVTAVASFDELPQLVKEKAKAHGVGPKEMRGITLGGGRVFVVHGNHSSLADVQATIVHEVYGHVGLRALFGPDIYRRLNKLYLSLGDSKVRALAEKYGVDAAYFDMANQLKASPAVVRRAGGATELRNGWLAEELLAHIAERETGTLRQQARELVGAIRAWLREHGFMQLSDLGMTDIAHILKQGRLALETQSNFDGVDAQPAFAKNGAGERNLVVLHNLSPDNLLHADSAGGLPVPSLGIAKVDSPFSGYGNITLIGPSGMIDPEAGVPVYDRDAYTSRFPTMNYKRPKRAKADALYERLQALRGLGGDGGQFQSMLWDTLVNSNSVNPSRVSELFDRYTAPRMLYAQEVLGKTIKTPMRDVRLRTELVRHKPLRDFLQRHGRTLRYLDDTTQEQYDAAARQLDKVVAEALASSAIGGKDEKVSAMLRDVERENLLGDDGAVSARGLERLLRSAEDFGKKEPDSAKLAEAVNRVVKRDDAGYVAWVNQQLAGLFDEPTITLRGKEVAPTLDNLVAAMTMGATAGAEKTMTASAGKTVAQLGKRFKSVAEIQAARDQVVSEAQENEAKKTNDATLDQYRSSALAFFTEKDWRGNVDTWAGMDAAMEVLADAGKRGSTDAAIRQALAKRGFKSVDQAVVNLAREAIDALRNSPTNYFEAKPQRAVGLGEFRGAVLPRGTDPKVLAVLDGHGIQVLEYGKGDGAREKAIATLTKRLDKAGKDVLFSRSASTTGATVATITDAIRKAYGNVLDKLQAKGLVTLVQSQDDAIEAAAQARAAKTGQPVEQARSTLRASVKNSVADQTQTEAFRKWFGDSKVVDADGNPLRVYHGTTADFSAFDPDTVGDNFGRDKEGFFFTGSTVEASGYADERSQFLAAGIPDNPPQTPREGANVMPVYLSLQNPLTLERYTWAIASTPETEIDEQGISLIDFFDGSNGDVVRYAQANGHDGVLLQRGGKTLAVAFLPEQIKSAIGNRGTFDPADPDIRRSSNGSIQGFFDPQSGQSFMIADGLTNEAAPGVLVHEVGIHMAADTSSDKGKAAFDKIVERAGQLLELGRGNVFFDRVNQRMRDAGETSNEEAAAYIAEEYERDRVNAPASVKRWVTDFMAAVRAWLFGKGVLVKASDLGAADIAAIARANVRKAARGDGMLSGDGSVRRSDASPTEDEVRGLMQQYADVAGAPTEAQMRAAVQDYRETERAYGGKPAYDKARAAGKTKLNYGQWVQTRTQHFKNWFGDWQALAAQERLDAMEPIKVRVPDAWQNLPVNELRQRVEESLLQLMESGEPLHHPEVGEVSVVRKGIKKALASSADPAKLRVLGDLRHAFEWSFLAGTQAAQGEEHNVLAYDKLLARLDVGGSEVVAVFTVKRLTDGSQFYNTVALDDGQNKTPVASPRDTPIAGEHATSANTGVSDFVRRPLARVKPDSVSKVVDPQTGEPAVVFHGTHGDFSEFNAQDRVSTDSGMLGSGHYFTPDPKRAGDWYATRRDRETGAALAGGNVMPVFLNARDPLEIRLQAGQDLQSVLVEMSRDMGLERMPSMSNDEANAKWAPLFTQSLRERGHDGVRLVLSNGVTQEVSVFDGTSAKSATGNIGTFGESRDIRFSYATAAAQGSTYTLPEERFGGLRRKMQDYFIRALEVQNAVARQGGTVDEQTDFYRAEELSSGRRAALVQDFGNNVVQPLMERAAQLGIDLSELSLYAYAKHAQERNEYIATINDRLPDGGSGMTTADANAIMDKVRQEGREQDFEELHQGLMDITASTRALQLSEGLITQDEFDAMQAQYQNYIPLRGFEQVDENDQPTGRSPGKGFNIRGRENLRALGRSSRAGELIENAIHDYIRTVDRGERNQVGKVFLNFVLQNPDAGLWEVDATRTRAAMDHQTGKVKGVTSIDKGEDTIAVKVAGRDVYVRIHDPLLLRAMRKSHTDDRGDNERLVVRALGLYTALLRNTLTRYNPEFALTNALRDYGFGMAAMVDVLGEKGAAKFTAHYAGAVAAAHRNKLNKSDPKNREWDKYFTEFRLAGGMTAGFYVKNTEEIGRDIRSMLLAAGAAPKTKTEALFASSPARAIAAAGRVLEYAGSVSENAARVAAYRTAREMGKSPSEAASIAKNLTTNFDRKGELGQVINAAYVFYNAAVQGSHRLLKMASNPKVAGYMAGFGVAGVMMALAAADWGGDDPDDGMAYWDKIPAYEKERNLIIMLPPGAQMAGEERVGTQGRYIKIPLQYGLNLPVAYGYAIADVIRNQRDKSRGMSPAKAGVTMASYLAGAFNPFGGSVDLWDKHSVMLAALPSVFDFAYQHALGVNGFGRDVAPFKSPFDTKPDSENYNLRQADSVSLGIARMLNRATGGSAAEAGGIDISAGTVENLIRNVSGGTGAFIYDVGNLAWKSVDRATGGDPDIFVREMPLYRRVYGELGGDVDQGIFYDSRKKTQEAAGIVKRSAELDMEPSEENQTLASMDKFANKATRDLAKLRREMIRVKQDGSLSNAEKKKDLRELRAARDQITAGFNQAFTEVMRAFFAEQKSTDKINQ